MYEATDISYSSLADLTLCLLVLEKLGDGKEP
jgi:hypothetical protein